MKEERRGRRGIFKGSRTRRLQGVITSRGSSRFEAARKRLSRAAGVDRASDADTIDYLSFVESIAQGARRIVLDDVKDQK